LTESRREVEKKSHASLDYLCSLALYDNGNKSIGEVVGVIESMTCEMFLKLFRYDVSGDEVEEVKEKVIAAVEKAFKTASDPEGMRKYPNPKDLGIWLRSPR